MSYTPEEITEKLDDQRHDIKSKRLSMSMEEVNNWVKRKRLILTPLYQRSFLWDDEKQSKLIESILLGFPLPPIFLYRVEDGYEVIDGVQRLNTIQRFMDNELKLQGLGVLDFCNGMRYNDFSEDSKITFDTSRLDAEFMEKGSNEEAKYELFVRLNTGGTQLENQQIRDCYIQMRPKGEEYYKDVIIYLAGLEVFQNSLILSDKQETNSFANELVVRFLTIANPQYTESLYSKNSVVIHNWLDDQILKKVKEDSLEIRQLDVKVFTKTFEILSQLEGDAIRRYDTKKNKFVGNTTLKAFEFVAIGIGHNIYKAEKLGIDYNLSKEKLLEKIKYASLQ
jgi:hypothetical protein